jgi:hypothetical protein
MKGEEARGYGDAPVREIAALVVMAFGYHVGVAENIQRVRVRVRVRVRTDRVAAYATLVEEPVLAATNVLSGMA